MSKRLNKTFLVTNPYLLPVRFAQRLTASQLAFLQALDYANPFSRFNYQIYSRKLQQQLKSNPEYTKLRYSYFR